MRLSSTLGKGLAERERGIRNRASDLLDQQVADAQTSRCPLPSPKVPIFATRIATRPGEREEINDSPREQNCSRREHCRSRGVDLTVCSQGQALRTRVHARGATVHESRQRFDSKRELPNSQAPFPVKATASQTPYPAGQVVFRTVDDSQVPPSPTL